MTVPMSVAVPVLMAVIVTMTVAGVVVGVSHSCVLSDDGIRRDHRLSS
jgi:hypothetical protein